MQCESIQKNTKEYLDSCYVEIFSQLASDDLSVADIVIHTLQCLCEKEESRYYTKKKKFLREYVAQKLFDVLNKYFSDENSADYLIFSQKVDAFFYCYKLFLGIQEDDFEDKNLYLKILQSKNRATARRDFSFVPEIIVSFTSFPARIETVYKTLASVYNQTIKPDRVILWLAENQFPQKDVRLPQSLLAYKKLGFEIRWCNEDLRPHKKYYYAMKEFRESIIITVDDDIVYDRYMLETLLASYLHFPYAVSAMRTHLILGDETGKILPYRKWKHEFSGVVGIPSMQLFATGCSGVLYPPGCVDIDSFTVGDIKQLALNADDIWLKILQIQQGTPVVLARENKPLEFVPGSQEIALYKTNSHGNENDVQMTNVLNKYDKNGDIIKAIFSDKYTSKTVLSGVKVTEDNDFLLLNNLVTEHVKTLCFDAYNALAQSEKNNSDLTRRLSAETDKVNKLNKYLADIKNSVSFRIGRIITRLPRYIKEKIKGR